MKNKEKKKKTLPSRNRGRNKALSNKRKKLG